MKVFIKRIIFYSVPVLLVLTSVNIIVDPANLVSGIEIKIAKYLSQGFNVTNVPNIEERMLQKNIIQNLHTSPSIIILGSSRIMLIGKEYYGDNCFNNGVSGASIEDIIAIYQLYIENDHSDFIRKIVIGIDPWLFNENNGQNRWESLANEYYGFLSKNPLPIIKNIPLFKYSQFLSPSYFQASIKFIPEYLIQLKSNEYITPTNKINNIGFTRLNDGTIEYDTKYRSKSEIDIENEFKGYISGDIYSMENYFELSEKVINIFNLFIETITKNDTEIEFLLMPYPAMIYAYLTSNEKYKIISLVEDYIIFYGNEHNINVYGSYNPEQFGLNTNDFYDGMHLNNNGIKKVLK